MLMMLILKQFVPMDSDNMVVTLMMLMLVMIIIMIAMRMNTANIHHGTSRAMITVITKCLENILYS